MTPLFADRSEAGVRLARELAPYAGRPGALVLGVPRGGVAVAAEVARTLDLPLDVFLVRRLEVPGCEELALGGVATSGIVVWNEDVIFRLGIPRSLAIAVAEREKGVLAEKEFLLRGDPAVPQLAGRTVILVDEGLATVESLRPAITALRAGHVQHVVAAVPVAACDALVELGKLADAAIAAATPHPFGGVALWYADHAPLTDEDVRRHVQASRQPKPAEALA